jgi:uncharacterized membrane protein YkvA (DUF1232 family)
MDKENITTPGENVRVEKYGKHYNENALWGKLNSLPRSTIRLVLERVLLLRELLFDANTPHWVRGTIIGCIGFVIFPFDAIPDFIPGIGYLDDFAVMGLVLGNLDYLVTDDIKKRVKDRMAEPLEAQPTDAEATT